MARKGGREKSRTECLRIEKRWRDVRVEGPNILRVMKGWRKTSKSKPTITFPTSLDFFFPSSVSFTEILCHSELNFHRPLFTVALHQSASIHLQCFPPSILPTQHFPSPFAMPMRSRYHPLITERRKEREDLPRRCCFVFAGVFDAGVMSPSCRKTDYFFSKLPVVVLLLLPGC